MNQKRNPPAGDSYERYISYRSQSSGDSYERYIAQSRSGQYRDTAQPVYHRELTREVRRKNALLYLVLVAAVLVVIFSLAFLIRSVTDNRAYDKYMNAAQVSTLGGDYDSALASLRKAASIDMSDECLLMIAQCYESLGNYDRAIEALRYMTSSDSAISSKIASIEQKQRLKATEGTVTIGGVMHSITETSLVMDNQSAGNEILPEIAQLYALNNLSLAGNGISDITPLSVLGGLTTLNLSGNSISSVSALAGLTALRTLYLDNNPITDLSPLYSLTSLTALSIKGVSITDSELKALSSALPNCAINGANAKEEEQAITLGGATFAANVATLDLSGRGITDISALSRCENLNSLNLSNNYISDITPLMDIPGLQYLYLSGNNITDLRPLMGLTGIKALDVSSNFISSTVSLGSNTSLLELNLANNSISNFTGIAKLKNLTALNLSGTGFSDADTGNFYYLTKLINLNLENNSGLTGEGYDALRAIIPACNISHSDLVYSIFAGGSTTVTTDTLVLDMSGQGLSDLSFLMQLRDLQTVNLSNNAITNIYYFQYTESWRTLSYLDLSRNFISDIFPVTSLRNLTTLNLSDNQISDITPLYAMTNLRELYLGGNPLTDEQIFELNAALPNCFIVFR